MTFFIFILVNSLIFCYYLNMGYKTEINYIAKYSQQETQQHFDKILEESLDKENDFLEKNTRAITFTKSGHRTYVLNSPIFLANHNWEIIARGCVTKTIVSKESTTIEFRVLNIYSDKEVKILSEIIQRGEKSNEKANSYN